MTRSIVALLYLCLCCLLECCLSENITGILFDDEVPVGETEVLGPFHMESEGWIDFQLVGFNVTTSSLISEDFVVDIAVFRVPSTTTTTTDSGTVVTATAQTTAQDVFDMAPELGIGLLELNTNDGTKASWQACCTEAAKQKGICQNVNRLIIRDEVFEGEVVTSTFLANDLNSKLDPNTTLVLSQTIDISDDPLLATEEEGDYAILFANCNSNARNVRVGGRLIVDAFFTVEEVADSAVVFLVLAVCYLVLIVWFYRLMHIHQETRIDIEKWILLTMGMGLLETTVRSLNYFVFADTDHTYKWMDLLGVTIASCRMGVSRCLLIMVSLGWGVTKASLAQSTMIILTTLVAVLTVLTFLEYSDLLYDQDTVSDGDEEDSSGFIGLMEYIRTYIDLLLFLWIPFALNKTMKELKASSQQRKLVRYRWLVGILVGGAALTVLSFLVVLAQAVDVNKSANLMLLEEGNAISFFLILTAVAVLWRPNPNARDYAYVVELTGDDDDDDRFNDESNAGAESAVEMIKTEIAVPEETENNSGTETTEYATEKEIV